MTNRPSDIYQKNNQQVLYVKKCLTSLFSMEIQMKTTLRWQLPQLEGLLSKRQKETNMGEDFEEWELLKTIMRT